MWRTNLSSIARVEIQNEANIGGVHGSAGGGSGIIKDKYKVGGGGVVKPSAQGQRFTKIKEPMSNMPQQRSSIAGPVSLLHSTMTIEPNAIIANNSPGGVGPGKMY